MIYPYLTKYQIHNPKSGFNSIYIYIYNPLYNELNGCCKVNESLALEATFFHQPLVANMIICIRVAVPYAPWCWKIYQHLPKQNHPALLVNIPAPWSIWVYSGII